MNEYMNILDNASKANLLQPPNYLHTCYKIKIWKRKPSGSGELIPKKTFFCHSTVIGINPNVPFM